MTHPYFRGTATPRILAHRGLVTADAARSGVVENSFAAVAAAHAAGVTYVESDCHLTKDGQVVLFHDADLVRVTGDPRKVAEVSAHELEALMADRGGLITLAQALDAFPDVRFNLDVKAPAAAEPTGRLVAPHAHRVLLTSFSEARRRLALASAAGAGAAMRPATSPGRERMTRILLAAHSCIPSFVARALKGLDALQIPERHGGVLVLTRGLLTAAHRAGLEVHVWTVNDPDDMRRLVNLGVDGVVTDRADVAARVLH